MIGWREKRANPTPNRGLGIAALADACDAVGLPNPAAENASDRCIVLHHGDRLLEREDPDVSDALLQLLKDEGVEV